MKRFLIFQGSTDNYLPKEQITYHRNENLKTTATIKISGGGGSTSRMRRSMDPNSSEKDVLGKNYFKKKAYENCPRGR